MQKLVDMRHASFHFALISVQVMFYKILLQAGPAIQGIDLDNSEEITYKDRIRMKQAYALKPFCF